MRMFIRVVLAIALLSVLAAAQDAPSAEIFGGYSYIRQDVGPQFKLVGLDHPNSHGWMAGGAGFLNRWFGIKGEVNGVYARPDINIGGLIGGALQAVELKQDLYTYTFGPTIAYRAMTGVQPFAHALFGGGHRKIETDLFGFNLPGTSNSENAFAMQLGGGADFAFSPSVAIRGQVDWIQTRFNDLADDRQNHLKASAGIVFRFGAH
ncbi:MAG TPA: outer membrane beta-barrel protein [Clostridia bacterium]|nr:outer membrane beta-barrel protein [Clostridia bacterium]